MNFLQFSIETNKCTIYVRYIKYVIYKILLIYIVHLLVCIINCYLFFEVIAKHWNYQIFILFSPPYSYWFSEYISLIFLKSINRFMFVIEVLGIFYEVENKYSNASWFHEVNPYLFDFNFFIA